MARDSRRPSTHGVPSAFQSSTFDRDVEIRVHEAVGSASISPCGRDVVLASAAGLHIVDLDSPYTAPRYLSHHQQWAPADVQWSPFACRDYWIVSTSNQKALVWNLDLNTNGPPIQHVLHAHDRAITDINFSAHLPDVLATCSVDSFVHCWDLRRPIKPVMSFADWKAGATQVKWNRQDQHVLASSHDKFLHIWDDRMGARPLKTIEAHTTKIYGLDWNRIRAEGIITCSLDRSIKVWDYTREDSKPERVFRTQFPVWRARHTPFGWGVLALPQRGDNNLHLYDRRLSKDTPRVGFVDPVHSFSGHHSNVKEFLWRPRGGIENGVDNRDFQLISWGMDRVLHLHRVEPHILKNVGYEKGKQVRRSMATTRQGAMYKTFNISKPAPKPEETEAAPVPQPKGLLGSLVIAAGMAKMPPPIPPMIREQASMTYSGKMGKRTQDPIKWMQGVTMRSRANTMSKSHFGLASPENLRDEITTVSQKYTKVKFETADVHGRTARVTLNGPWGVDDKPAFLRVNFEFPEDYPAGSGAICTLEKTAAGISEEALERLTEEMQSIVNHYQHRKVGCLEAVITYLLGERGLEESITLPALQNPYDMLSPTGDSSSEDEDDVVDGNGQDLETSAEGVLDAANVNMPLPKECGAYWSHDGRLVCFFPPKPEPKPIFNLDALRAGGGDRNRGHRHFEGFGRLQEDSPGPKRKLASADENLSDDSAESWASSSSSSSDESYEDIARLPSRFHPPAAWRAAALRMPKTSSHSGSGGAMAISRRDESAQTQNRKSVLSIHHFEDLVPSHRVLAEEYMIFGDGPSVCLHNAEVCHRYGFEDYAATWEICRHLLFNEVPLEILEQKERKEPILIEAKRQMVRVRSKDSGLDLAFDEPESVARPKLTGRVKWGCHPFGGAWLIPELFEHYERLADVQMLAMLSCVFCEPAAREGISNVLAGIEAADLPIAMQAPAFSLDYFPSAEVAWSLFETQKVTVQNATPEEARSAGPDGYFDQRVTTYGSAGSSNGPWERDLNGPQTPYSTGDTPPVVTPYSQRSHRSSNMNSLSTSPEQTSLRSSRRTNSNLSAAFSFSKAFTSLSTSPATQDRLKAAEAELSTSLPAAPTSSVTWQVPKSHYSGYSCPVGGAVQPKEWSFDRRNASIRHTGSTTFYSSASSNSPEKRRGLPTNHRNNSSMSFALDGSYDSNDDDDGYETDESYYDASKVYTPTKKKPEEKKIKVTLKNQDHFDMEGHASIPLMPPEHLPKRHAYREAYAEQLGAWGLHIQVAEIMKFNGLMNYWTNKSRVYSLEAQTENSNMSSIGSVDLPLKHENRIQPRERSPSFGPLVPPSKMMRANSSVSYKHDLFSKAHSGPPSRAMSDVFSPNNDSIWSSYKVSKPRVELERSHDHENKKNGNRREFSNCHICMERIQGLSVSCTRGEHRAHATCYAGYIHGRSDQEIRETGVSCGCIPYHLENANGPSKAEH